MVREDQEARIRAKDAAREGKSVEELTAELRAADAEQQDAADQTGDAARWRPES